MANEKIRWGVLGTARIADAHVRAIKESGTSELAAIASRDLASAQDWARERDVPHAFGSYDEMLASDVIDAVFVPLPNALHKEWSIRAMQHGKHVLCEKPLASNADEVRELIAAADASGVSMMEGFMYRFHPQMARLRKLLADGAIGKPVLIRATFGFLLQKPDDVRWRADLAGGSLMDVGCYCVNAALLVSGGVPATVSAQERLSTSGVDESLAGTMEFPDGTLAVIDCSFRTGGPMQQSLSISGTRGSIYLSQPFRADDNAPTIVVQTAPEGTREGATETIEVPRANQYTLMHESFARAILGNQPLAYTLRDSLATMQVIDALKVSARTGRRVEV